MAMREESDSLYMVETVMNEDAFPRRPLAALPDEAKEVLRKIQRKIKYIFKLLSTSLYLFFISLFPFFSMFFLSLFLFYILTLSLFFYFLLSFFHYLIPCLLNQSYP